MLQTNAIHISFILKAISAAQRAQIVRFSDNFDGEAIVQLIGFNTPVFEKTPNCLTVSQFSVKDWLGADLSSLKLRPYS